MVAVLALAALAGCSGKAGGQAAASAPSRAPSPIEGTWRSARIYEPEFIRWYRAAGGKAEDGNGNPFPSVTAAAMAFFAQLGNGARRYAVISIRFESGYFAEFESGDGGQAVEGDRQTYKVSGHRLTLTEPGCTSKYSFAIRGRQLRLHLINQCPMGWFGTTLYASYPFQEVS